MKRVLKVFVERIKVTIVQLLVPVFRRAVNFRIRQNGRLGRDRHGAQCSTTTRNEKKWSSRSAFSVCDLLKKESASRSSASTMSNPKFQCRMYEERYPEVDDVVMVNVSQIAEMGAYVRLLEYDNVEGMILLSELSRRRIRSIQKLIRVGRNEVVVVLRVDKEKGYIDLSKRRVSPEDIQKCEEKFNKSKAVHSILRHVAEKQDLSLEGLYQQIGWPLFKKYGHAFEAFKLAITYGHHDRASADDAKTVSQNPCWEESR